MDLLFVFILLGLLLYSGVAILYFIVKAFLPSGSQKRSSSSQRTTSARQQQRTVRRNTSTSQNRNANKQATKDSWKSLTSEIKEIMNEMDGEPSKKTSTQRRTSSPPATERSGRVQRQPLVRSHEGGGSTEGSYSREGMGGFEGRGNTEGTGSYEGREFHPRGHSTQQRPTKKAVSSAKKQGTDRTTSVPNLRKNLVNAVIYKEILDQPRSKRPIR